MSNIDLTDLRILDQLQKTGSISRAAEKIMLSQPSISLRLGRLRRHFKDVLFVRTSAGMRPTPRAEMLIEASRQALDVFDRIKSPELNREALLTEKTFRICMTTTGQITILPRLLKRIEQT